MTKRERTIIRESLQQERDTRTVVQVTEPSKETLEVARRWLHVECGATATESLARLLDAHAAKALADWMIENSFATGHGDTAADLLKELTWQIRELRDHAAKAWLEEASIEWPPIPRTGKYLDLLKWVEEVNEAQRQRIAALEQSISNGKKEEVK